MHFMGLRIAVLLFAASVGVIASSTFYMMYHPWAVWGAVLADGEANFEKASALLIAGVIGASVSFGIALDYALRRLADRLASDDWPDDVAP